ncbi:MAG TPA: hypothetical protein VNY36_03515 [Bacteroidia bacterium]|jgi:hypothetical protein|nr:hypothetical protein [Bacteroidia bacterium]
MKAITEREVIEKLSKLDLSGKPYMEVHSLISELGQYIVFATTFPPGQVILRARCNYGNEVFCKVSDLSYKPLQNDNTFQRASTPYKTMFYGGIMNNGERKHGENDSARIIGLCEISPLMRDKSITSGVQRITYGKWVTTESITVASIIHHGRFAERNPMIERMQREYEETIKKYPVEMANKSKFICEYFADEFAKEETPNDYDYIISAIYAERVSSYSVPGIQLSGVLYPSVRSEATGFNIALTKECLDRGALRLDYVAECTIYREGSSLMVDNNKEANVIAGQNQFTLCTITDPQVHVGMERIYSILKEMNSK